MQVTEAAFGRYLWADEGMARNNSGTGPVADVLAPRMMCTGGVIAARTCYFEDLLWDTQRQRFAFFSASHTQPHMMTDLLLASDELDPAEPWVKLRRCVPAAR